MEIKKYPIISMYPLVAQQIKLQRQYPEAISKIKKSTLYWDGWLCPTPLSRQYHVRVEYKRGKRPDVVLMGKNLIGINREDFPHRFVSYRGKQGNNDKYAVRICLHLRGEFTGAMFLADTIVPWAVEWLYFYEIWLATGKWCGGGVHPS